MSCGLAREDDAEAPFIVRDLTSQNGLDLLKYSGKNNGKESLPSAERAF